MPRIQVRRWNQYGMTTLQLSGPELELELKLVSLLGKRERRTVARSFLRQIRPWLKHFSEIKLDHSVYADFRSKKASEREIRLFQSSPIHTQRGSLGFEIRIARLKLGLTQAQLAKRVGIPRSHLSDIERGIHFPRTETRTAIDKILRENPGAA